MDEAKREHGGWALLRDLFRRLPTGVTILVVIGLFGIAVVATATAVISIRSGEDVDAWGYKVTRPETTEEKNCRELSKIVVANTQMTSSRIGALDTQIGVLQQQAHELLQKRCLPPDRKDDPFCTRGMGSFQPTGQQAAISGRYEHMDVLRREKQNLEEELRRERQLFSQKCIGAGASR